MYSDKFNKAFEYVMYFEGGYVNDPHDLGGETKYGISKRSYPHLDIKHLTREQAKKIYYCDFWVKGKFEQMTDENIAIKCFDLSVNMGLNTGARILQRALRATNQNVVEDGIVGNETMSSVNKTDATSLLSALKSEAAGYYRLIANNNSTQRRFLRGGLNRAYADVN